MAQRTGTLPPSYEIDGSKLRAIRMKNGETLKPFADRVGISAGFLSQLELGNKPCVKPSTFNNLCAALGYETEEQRLSILTPVARRRLEKVAA